VDSTPVRSLGTRGDDGTVLLRDIGLDYRDGGEEAVLKLIGEAKDISSTSDELVRGAVGWAQTYHLHPARANVVRALDLPRSARVLEIGAGCGAITRFLGERCAAVDALEPVPARAAAARARTRDLDNVEVFVGELDDVPRQPAYDVVAVIGVLEYVAAGGRDLEKYVAFLRSIYDRLVDGGSLVLAIENRLGVKYLAGAPEDHSDRPFDSIEGYPAGTPARTFARNELSDLLAQAGLEPTFYSAFPDYKMTRAVLGEMPQAARSLYHRIPQFPSPDWVSQRAHLADERSYWRTLVEAGLEGQTGNSFVVLATKGASSGSVWRDGVGAVFYSTGRRSRFSAETEVRVAGESVRFERKPLTDEGPQPGDRFRIVGSDHPYESGDDLLQYIAEHPDADLQGLMSEWLALLAADDTTSSPDVVPHNLVISPDGRPHAIDVELLGDIARDQIVRRGVYWMAHHLAQVSPMERWPELRTVRELAISLGPLAGLPEDGSWLAQAMEEELEVQLEVQNGPQLGMDADAWRARFAEVMRNDIDRELKDLPLGDRLPARAQRLQRDLDAERRAHFENVSRLNAELEAANAQVTEWRGHYEALMNSRTMRVARAGGRVVEGARKAARRGKGHEPDGR
jgi:SAM-dependent methyltransferase